MRAQAGEGESRNSSSEPGSSWSVDMGPDGGPQRFVLDEGGLGRESSAANGMLVMRRCSAEQARDLTYRKIDGRDALMFPIDREIGMVDRLESLTVELRWKDIGFGPFPPGGRPSACRREVAGWPAVSGGGADRSLPGLLAKPRRLPISGPEFAADLGARSRFIKPAATRRSSATAREVTRGKTGRAFEAVKRAQRVGLEVHRDRLHPGDTIGAGGPGVPQGEVHRVRDAVCIAGAGGRHPHPDRPGRPDHHGPVGRSHVE